VIPEHEEPFDYEGTPFSGIWTSFDSRSPAGDSHIITRTLRILVDDEVADQIPERALIRRLKTNQTYRVKTRVSSGVGASEFDLERNSYTERYEGEF
jgi:hypothetical protein